MSFFLLSSTSLFSNDPKDDRKEAQRGANIALEMVKKKIDEDKESFCKLDKTTCLLCSIFVSQVRIDLSEHPEIFNKNPSKSLPPAILEKIINQSKLCKEKESKRCLTLQKFINEEYNDFDGSPEEFEKWFDDYLKIISSKYQTPAPSENKKS